MSRVAQGASGYHSAHVTQGQDGHRDFNGGAFGSMGRSPTWSRWRIRGSTWRRSRPDQREYLSLPSPH